MRPAVAEAVTIRVTDLSQAQAALEQARAAGVEVVLVSAAEVTAFAGVGYWRALEQAVGQSIVIDCGDDAGLVMAALRAGCRELRFTGPEEVAAKLEGMAKQVGGMLLRELDGALAKPAPPLTFDKGSRRSGMTHGDALHLGIDVGTSGVRGVAIGADGEMVAQASASLPAPEVVAGGLRQDPELWWVAVIDVIRSIVAAAPRRRIDSLAVDGTSGTLLLADDRGTPLEPAGMYNDASAAHLALHIKAVAPPESGAHGATSPLARLLMLQERHPHARYAMHQADWVAARLTGRQGVSDDNNALKLGFDPVTRTWPVWLDQLGVRRELLPEVVVPGTPLGTMRSPLAASLGIGSGCTVVAGTTDGCASFLATGAADIGDGVTALGTTLTLKLLSDRPVFAPAHGVYSHRIGERWLVGGASNSGGKALLRFFSPDRMAELTPRLRPDRPTDLHWHPLPEPGERFPVADPGLVFEPAPLPDDEVVLFQGLLEGIAEVEQRSYRLLAGLGAPPLRSVRTVGGGAANHAWMEIRARLLGVPMLPPLNLEAGYGAALLARGNR